MPTVPEIVPAIGTIVVNQPTPRNTRKAGKWPYLWKFGEMEARGGWGRDDCKTSTPGSNPGGASNFPQ